MDIRTARRTLRDNDLDITGLTDDEILTRATLLSTQTQTSQTPMNTTPQTTIDLVTNINSECMQGGLQAGATYLDASLEAMRAAMDADTKQAIAAIIAARPKQQPQQTTRTITLDANGNQVIPTVNPKLSGAMPAHDIWDDVNGDYSFPVADYDEKSPRYHNVQSLHRDGTLQIISEAFTAFSPIWLKGEAGTGKTALVDFIAASTSRPFTRIAHHASNEVGDLIGQYTMKNGTVEWQDGAFTRAIRIPYNVILLDEPTQNAQACQMYQTVLDEGYLTIEATSEVVHVAEGVQIVAADNTAGHGDDTGRYDGTAPVNTAFLDRFDEIIPMDYMTENDEQNALVVSTGCKATTAIELVYFANAVRRSDEIDQPVSFRRLKAMAKMLSNGHGLTRTLDIALMNHIRNDTDREAIAGIAKTTITEALL